MPSPDQQGQRPQRIEAVSPLHISKPLLYYLNRDKNLEKTQDGLGTGLTAHVDNVVLVGKAVERGGRALGVGTHVLEVEPIANVELHLETDALRNAVNAVTSWAPDTVLNGSSLLVLARSRRVVHGLTTRPENLGNRVLVIEHDRAEVSIETVVDVNHVAGLLIAGGHAAIFAAIAGDGHGQIVGRRRDSTARDDVASQSKGSRSVISAWLRNDVDARVRREIVVKRGPQNAGHLLKGVVGTEAATDIKCLQVEAVSGRLLKHSVGILDSLEEGSRVRGTRADVEADADHIEAKLARQGEETLSRVKRSTELEAQAAQRRRVIREDTEIQLGRRI